MAKLFTAMGLIATLIALVGIFVDVGAFDSLTFTLAPVVVLSACLVASWLPARRATRVNPVTALRAD
jgi:ABC-type antimicrobial peptide transport system permease subunit